MASSSSSHSRAEMSASSSSRKSSLPGRGGGGSGDGLLSSVSSSVSQSAIVARGKAAACEAATVAKKLLRSTGKASWIAGTTFLILVVPLIIEMDREQQLNELELQQSALLGAPATPTPLYPTAAPSK